MLRRNIPKMNDDTFQQIYPCDNIICVTQHQAHSHAASMMIVIWRRDWNDASKFQYLMQILQVNVGDYIPRYQIFVESRR